MLCIPDNLIQVTYQKDANTVGELKTFYRNFTVEHELVASFTGLQQLFAYLQRYLADIKDAPRNHSGHRGYENNFYYFKDYHEALTVYQEHPEEVIKFTENDLQLQGGDAAGLDISYDVTGDFIDIDRYLSGEPEHFGNMYNGIPRGRRITIMYGTAWSGNTTNALINERSKCILRLADWLESQGVRVQIIAISSMECQHVEVTVKHFDEPLSLADVAVASHSDYFRRLIFRFAEYSKTWRSGYGSSLSFDDFIRSTDYKNLPINLQDESVVYCGVQNQSNVLRVFTDLEEKLATLLGDPYAEPQFMKVMI